MNSPGLRLVITSVFITFFLSAGQGWSDEAERSEGRQKAVEIAQQQREVQAFLTLLDSHRSCVNLKVERACESAYVTCVDNPDAWVVHYLIDPKCEIKTDGRLSVNLLIDVASGQVASRYPEIQYFDEPDFCLEEPDCVAVPAEDAVPQACLNFIYAPLKASSAGPVKAACRCQEGRCRLAES
jgi:hypothetical protein